MKHILLTLLLLTSSAQANTVFVLGDSLCEWENSYADYLRWDHGHHVIQWCQGGRAMFSYTLPNDMRVRNDATYVLFLGINDTAVGIAVYFYRSKFNAMADSILAHRARLVVVKPPSIEGRNTNHIRNVISDWSAENPDVPVVDVMDVWDVSRTTDGIHPLPSLHRDIAQLIAGEL